MTIAVSDGRKTADQDRTHNGAKKLVDGVNFSPADPAHKSARDSMLRTTWIGESPEALPNASPMTAMGRIIIEDS